MAGILLIIGIILLILEIFTVSTFFMWVSFGFFAAGLTALVTDNVVIISIVGITVFILTTYFFREKFVSKFISKEAIKTSYEEILDKTGVVVKGFKGNSEEIGIVKIRGMEWSSKSNQNVEFFKDEKVLIKKIDGVKVIVEKE